MARHIEVSMDGIPLSSVGAILIQAVDESPAEMELTYGARLIRPGQDLTVNRRKSLRVTVTFVIRELRDLAKRNAILQAVNAWASGSILELSNHPGQRLRVRCKSFASLGTVRNYATEIKLEFEADEVPYWEDIYPLTVEIPAAYGYTDILVPGTAPTPVTVKYTPKSASLASFTVTAVGGGVTKQIELTGMQVGKGSTVSLMVDEADRFGISSGSYNLLQYRSIASADDLTMPAGKVRVTWNASTSGNLVIMARGRWI